MKPRILPNTILNELISMIVFDTASDLQPNATNKYDQFEQCIRSNTPHATSKGIICVIVLPLAGLLFLADLFIRPQNLPMFSNRRNGHTVRQQKTSLATWVIRIRPPSTKWDIFWARHKFRRSQTWWWTFILKPVRNDIWIILSLRFVCVQNCVVCCVAYRHAPSNSSTLHVPLISVRAFPFRFPIRIKKHKMSVFIPRSASHRQISPVPVHKITIFHNPWQHWRRMSVFFFLLSFYSRACSAANGQSSVIKIP